MFVIKALFKGISGLFLMLSLALSFAPATDKELSALGPDYGRRDIAQHRLAAGALKLEKFGLLDALASTTDDMDVVTIRMALQSIVDGEGTMAFAVPTSRPTVGGFNARRIEGGARFVTVD